MFSFFLHLARRFWNQTYTPNNEKQLTPSSPAPRWPGQSGEGEKHSSGLPCPPVEVPAAPSTGCLRDGERGREQKRIIIIKEGGDAHSRTHTPHRARTEGGEGKASIPSALPRGPGVQKHRAWAQFHSPPPIPSIVQSALEQSVAGGSQKGRLALSSSRPEHGAEALRRGRHRPKIGVAFGV